MERYWFRFRAPELSAALVYSQLVSQSLFKIKEVFGINILKVLINFRITSFQYLIIIKKLKVHIIHSPWFFKMSKFEIILLSS